MRRCLVLLVAAALIAPAMAVADESPIGKKVEAFGSQDYRGKQTSLSDFGDSQLVVVAFLGTECPLAKLYGPRLQELADEFSAKGVAFVGVDSNRQDSVTELAHYARTHEIKFPIIKDDGNKIADALGAIRTPEVFLLDRDRVVRYWGRVDDQYGFQTGGVAYRKDAAERRDLAEAINELLAGKEVSTAIAANQGCHIGRIKTPDDNAQVTYSSHVAEILNNNCVQCHRSGEIGPFSLTSYDEAVGWAEMIKEVINEKRMPPWHADEKFGKFKNDARLSKENLELLNKWVDAGAPQGDPQRVPALPEFPEGWLIPKPDEVIYMADEPYEVQAEGTVEYQRFIVDPKWEEDRWVKAMECKPGNPGVVHHVIIYLVPPNVAPSGQAGRLQSNWLGAFAPGLRPQTLEEGLARYVQAGSKLLFEVHYTPNGTPQKDLSYAGFVFADPKTVKKEVAVQNAGNFTFKIPANDPNHQVESEFVFRHPTTLLSVSPHMHVRGKDFRYDLIYPDGRTETILWVPQYDFGWQTTYMLEEPLHLPRGTKMHCVAHFDNSDENFANPDPSKDVTWGEQTWEEMMFGWFEMSLTDQDLTKPVTETASRAKQFLEAASAGPMELGEQIASLAPKAAGDEKVFELVMLQTMELMPQIDRMCITYVDGDKLRLMAAQERFGVRSSFRSKSTRVNAKGEALADYAQGDKIVANGDLNKAAGSVIQRLARGGMRSSIHVPVVIDGKKCTLNAWSTEADAFPEAAGKLLQELATKMAAGDNAQAKR